MRVVYDELNEWVELKKVMKKAAFAALL